MHDAYLAQSTSLNVLPLMLQFSDHYNCCKQHSVGNSSHQALFWPSAACFCAFNSQRSALQDEDRRLFSERVETPLSEAECHVSSVQGSHAETEQQSQPSTLPAGHYRSSSGQLQLQTGQAMFTKASRVCSPSEDDLTQETADDLERSPSDLSLSAVRPLSAHYQLHSMRSASKHDMYSSQGDEHLRSYKNLPHISYAASHLQLSQHHHRSHRAGSLQQLQPSHNPDVGSLHSLHFAGSQMLPPSVLTSSALQADMGTFGPSHALQQPLNSTPPSVTPLNYTLPQEQADQVVGSQPVLALHTDSSATAAAVREPLLSPICHRTVSVPGGQKQDATSSQATSESCQANTASLGMTVKAAGMIPPSEQYQMSTQKRDLQGWKRAKRTHKVIALILWPKMLLDLFHTIPHDPTVQTVVHHTAVMAH